MNNVLKITCFALAGLALGFAVWLPIRNLASASPRLSEESLAQNDAQVLAALSNPKASVCALTADLLTVTTPSAKEGFANVLRVEPSFVSAEVFAKVMNRMTADQKAEAESALADFLAALKSPDATVTGANGIISVTTKTKADPFAKTLTYSADRLKQINPEAYALAVERAVETDPFFRAR